MASNMPPRSWRTIPPLTNRPSEMDRSVPLRATSMTAQGIPVRDTLPPLPSEYRVLDPTHGPHTVHSSNIFFMSTPQMNGTIRQFSENPQSAQMYFQQSAPRHVPPSTSPITIISRADMQRHRSLASLRPPVPPKPYSSNEGLSAITASLNLSPPAPPPRPPLTPPQPQSSLPPRPPRPPQLFPQDGPLQPQIQIPTASLSSDPQALTNPLPPFQPITEEVASPEGDHGEDDLALALALSQSESVNQRLHLEQLANREEEDLARALAESLKPVITYNTFQGAGYVPDDKPGPSTFSGALTGQQDVHIPGPVLKDEAPSNSTPQITFPTTTPPLLGELGRYDKWRIPGLPSPEIATKLDNQKTDEMCHNTAQYDTLQQTPKYSKPTGNGQQNNSDSNYGYERNSQPQSPDMSKDGDYSHPQPTESWEGSDLHGSTSRSSSFSTKSSRVSPDNTPNRLPSYIESLTSPTSPRQDRNAETPAVVINPYPSLDLRSNTISTNTGRIEELSNQDARSNLHPTLRPLTSEPPQNRNEAESQTINSPKPTLSLNPTPSPSSADRLNPPPSPSPSMTNLNHFLDTDLLLGVSIGFIPPKMTLDKVPMQDPIPNIISLPIGRCPPLHLKAPSWRHMLKLMARLSGTRFEPTVEALAISRTDLRLRTVVQFVKPNIFSEDWHTILWFAIDQQVPRTALSGFKYDGTNVNVLPWSFKLSPIPDLLIGGPDNQTSKTYTIPATESVPYPTLPISFPSLAMYLQAALDNSRRHMSDSSSQFRKLAKMMQTCYPSTDDNPPSNSERSSVGGLFKRVIGRNGKSSKKGKSGGNEDTYELVTPFVPDEWG